VPGSFAKGKPENDAELWFGALNVSMGGSLAVRLGEIALSCSDPVRMPTSVVIAIPKGPLVIVPRPPVPDLATIAGALGFKALGAKSRAAQKWNKAVCFLTGTPSTSRRDGSSRARSISSSRALPLRFERNYDTASSGSDSPFGRGWSHNFDEAVWVERG
jgi:hypothetical protein